MSTEPFASRSPAAASRVRDAAGPGAVQSAAVPVASGSRLAERVRVVPPSGIRKYFDVIATMPDVISLGVGDADFTTPPQLVEEGVRSLRAGRTDYTGHYGTLQLRRALSHQQARR